MLINILLFTLSINPSPYLYLIQIYNNSKHLQKKIIFFQYFFSRRGLFTQNSPISFNYKTAFPTKTLRGDLTLIWLFYPKLSTQTITHPSEFKGGGFQFTPLQRIAISYKSIAIILHININNTISILTHIINNNIVYCNIMLLTTYHYIQ